MTIWVTLFLLLIIAEAIIGDFTALTISIGAIFAALVAYFNLGIIFQSIIFGLFSVSSFIFFRPILQKKLIPQIQHFTAQSFIGNKAEVIEKISKDKKGRIKIGGEIWFAESNCDVEIGEKVIISDIENTIMKVVPEKHLIDDNESFHV